MDYNQIFEECMEVAYEIATHAIEDVLEEGPMQERRKQFKDQKKKFRNRMREVGSYKR